MQINESPLKKCTQTGFMMLHTNLWLISDDKSLLKLIVLDLLKADNKKLISTF